MKESDILKIKEKIRKNPKYIHPCNKERLEDMKKLNFSSGYEYTCWLQFIGAMKKSSDIDREHKNKLAQDRGYKNDTDRRRADGNRLAKELGYKNFTEHQRELRYEKGKILPAEINENCALYFGIKTEDLIEKFLFTIFEHVKRTPFHDNGIDFYCKDPKKDFTEKYHKFKLESNIEYKIQHRSQCLSHNNGNFIWIFTIDYDQKNDFFLLTAWRDRESFEPMHIWLIHRNERIRKRKLSQYVGLGITNKPNYLLEFREYEIDELQTLKELINII